MMPEKSILFVLLVICLYRSCTAYCGSEWKEYSDYCYYVSNAKATWYEARTRCREIGARLTSIVNKREEQFVFSIRSEYHANYWVGLRLVVDFSSTIPGLGVYKWSWTDGSSDTYRKTKQYQGKGDCVSITGSETWQRVDCNTSTISYSYYTVHPIYYICKKEVKLTETTTLSLDPLTSPEHDLTQNTSNDITSTNNNKEVLNHKDNSVTIIATSVQTSIIVVLVISLIAVCYLRRKKRCSVQNKSSTISIPSARPSADPVDIYENADVAIPERGSVEQIQKQDNLKEKTSGSGEAQEKMGEENHVYTSLSEY